MSKRNNTSISDQVTTALAEMDDKLTPTSPGYSECAIVMASAFIGANERAITEALGYDAEFVALVGNRLRTAGIWDGADVDSRALKRWLGEGGGVAMFCDMNVARGSFVIAEYRGTEPMYSLSPAGKKDVERMLRA